MIAIRFCVCVTFLLLYAVQDVVATLFDECRRVVSSSCYAIPHRLLVKKLEIQDV